MELLIVIALIALLASLVLPAYARAKKTVLRISCLNNTHQVMIASQMYSEDFAGFFFYTEHVESDEAPLSLHPNYIRTLKTFICPNTRNIIRENVKYKERLRDLRWTSRGNRLLKTGGHSYEFFGFFGREDLYDIRKTARTTDFAPAQIVLMVDADDDLEYVPDDRNNFPDPINNHGASGWNWGFVDGHSEWVSAARTSQALYDSWMINSPN